MPEVSRHASRLPLRSQAASRRLDRCLMDRSEKLEEFVRCASD